MTGICAVGKLAWVNGALNASGGSVVFGRYPVAGREV